MDVRSRRMAVSLTGAIALAGCLVWWASRPGLTLDGTERQIDLGQYHSAEAQLRAYLGEHPGDETAVLLLARVLVSRPEPDPEVALGLIERIRPSNPRQAALARMIEGDAHFWAHRYGRAEAAWLEALQLDPKLPEVGWKLLNIYAAQGRAEDSKRLALGLFAVEPDERDRVQFLLQLIRHDAHPIEAGAAVHELEPVVRADPSDFRSATALGLALIRSGRAAAGLDLLRRSARAGEDREAWLAYLEGLASVGEIDELAGALDSLPRPLTGVAAFDAARGWLATQRGDSDAAALAYRRALEACPHDPALAYRLKAALARAGRSDDLASLAPRLESIARFPDVARAFFDEANERPDLGLRTDPASFVRFAEALRAVGRVEEADAWASLARRPAKLSLQGPADPRPSSW